MTNTEKLYQLAQKLDPYHLVGWWRLGQIAEQLRREAARSGDLRVKAQYHYVRDLYHKGDDKFLGKMK